jgi:guanine deaminase
LSGSSQLPVEASPALHRASILHFRGDPGAHDDPACFEYWERGALLVRDGRVQAVGPASELQPDGDMQVIDHGGRLIVPGFIDTHVHCPQTDIIAAGGRNLLDWLEQYAYPAEQCFADPAHARSVADFFLDELLENGTTTAQVLCTVHRTSVEQLFEAAAARRLRIIAGKVLMDTNSPDGLRETAARGERDTRELIETWHGCERLHYAVTVRFALTSSEAQLASTGALAREYPDVFIQSHLAENRDEIEAIRRAFPRDRSYLSVYDRFGLLRERATYAHGIYLDATDRQRLAESGAGLAFCPSSNLYLGSGLFDLAATDAAGVPYALATDVGAGSSFSMLRTMGEGYKVAQLLGERLSPLRAFYLATLAGARMLRLDAHIGHFARGADADFIVLDPEATPLLARRMRLARTLSEQLQIYMILGDDRAVVDTYILGRAVQRRTVRPRAMCL